MNSSAIGKLFLIPCSIGHDAPSLLHLPTILPEIISNIDVFIVENIRSARRFLIQTKISKPIDDLVFHEMEKHQNYAVHNDVLMTAFAGKNLGILSESGLPCIADPGHHWVWAAHDLGIKVVPISGPSSIFLLLMASGLNGQNFAFHGYLPKEDRDKKIKLKEIEQSALQGRTNILIETPYRNNAFLTEVINTLNPTLILSVGVNLSMENQLIKSHPIHEWKKQSFHIPKEPCVFAIGIRR